jgi:hypothetical protein
MGVECGERFRNVLLPFCYPKGEQTPNHPDSRRARVVNDSLVLLRAGEK